MAQINVHLGKTGVEKVFYNRHIKTLAVVSDNDVKGGNVVNKIVKITSLDIGFYLLTIIKANSRYFAFFARTAICFNVKVGDCLSVMGKETPMLI